MNLISKSILNLRLMRIYGQLVRDPNRTELIFKAVDLVSRDPDPRILQTIEAHAMADQGFRELYEEKYDPPQPALEELRRSPPGSFGEALYHHLHANGLSLELFPKVVVKRPLDYLNARAYAIHDFLHPLFGYSTSVEDELALQAVGTAQYYSPLSAMLISGGLLHILKQDPMGCARAIAKVSEGHRRGEAARFLLGIRLHEMLELPLADVRARCGVDRALDSFAS